MNSATQSTVRVRTRKPGKATLGLKMAAVHINDKTRDEMIAEAAYFLAQRRGFYDGHALEDWLNAEVQINVMLTTINARHR